MAHSHSGHDHRHGAHAHDRHYDHSRAPREMGRTFAIAATLNFGFVLIEAGIGLWAGSLALLADAGHNLSDVLSLLLAWGAAALASRAPSGRRTYGLRKGTVLASLANAVLLLVAVGAIASEAVRRTFDPPPVASGWVMAAAGAGVIVNTATALLFLRGRKDDLNVQGAFQHMAADAAVSLAVVVGAAIIMFTGQSWIDPALSLLIVAVIVVGTLELLRDSADLALDAAPRSIDVAAVRDWLGGLPGVVEVHDLHIWAMSTTETALTAHLVRPAQEGDGDAFLHHACEELSRRFGIGHSTLQVEARADAACRLSPAGVV